MDRTNHATVDGTERPGHVTVDDTELRDGRSYDEADGRGHDGTDGHGGDQTGGRGPDDTDGRGRSRTAGHLRSLERSGEPNVEVDSVEEGFRRTWNDVVDRSPHGTPFHRFEFLEAIERHADAEVHALVGWVDDDPVGVFPLFAWQPVRHLDVVFSPPPRMGLYVLGPAVIEPNDPARAERRNRRFVRGCLDWVQAEIGPSYVRVEATWQYSDVRPFAWSDHGMTPRYTYLVDLDRDEDDLFMAFSGDARSNVRDCRDADCSVDLGDAQAVRRIVASVNDRYAEQGKSFALDPAFVTDLYQTLPDGQVRPYATTVEGEFVGGMVALEYDGTIYRWQGGTVPAVELPVNDYLDWQIIRDGLDRDRRWYDLVGANTERLCEYKAKFDPELAAYHTVTGGNRLVRTGVEILNGRVARLRKSLMGI